MLNLVNGIIRSIKSYNDLLAISRWFDFAAIDHSPVLPINVSPLDSNAWLSGFIDAEGNLCFAILDHKIILLANVVLPILFVLNTLLLIKLVLIICLI
jgi:hypothetical protein